MTPTTAERTTPTGPSVAPREDAAGEPSHFLRAMERGPLVLDAGLGTRLCSRGLDPRIDDPCLWNLDRPEQVLDVHRRDARAGSRVLFTNTFGANRAWLARFGRGGDAEIINRTAVKLARQAAGLSGFVVGDVGPSTAEKPGSAAEQAVILVDAGVDALILETFRFEPAAAALAELDAIRGTVRVPLVVSLWQWPDAVEDAARRLIGAGASVVGLNCRPAISDVLSLVRRIAGAVECPILVKPGVAPGETGGGSAPSDFADAVPALLESHVRLIGGCCGTTEAHVAAIAAACAAHGNPESNERRGTAP